MKAEVIAGLQQKVDLQLWQLWEHEKRPAIILLIILIIFISNKPLAELVQNKWGNRWWNHLPSSVRNPQQPGGHPTTTLKILSLIFSEVGLSSRTYPLDTFNDLFIKAWFSEVKRTQENGDRLEYHQVINFWGNATSQSFWCLMSVFQCVTVGVTVEDNFFSSCLVPSKASFGRRRELAARVRISVMTIRSPWNLDISCKMVPQFWEMKFQLLPCL
jgi:hypothetical protein